MSLKKKWDFKLKKIKMITKHLIKINQIQKMILMKRKKFLRLQKYFSFNENEIINFYFYFKKT